MSRNEEQNMNIKQKAIEDIQKLFLVTDDYLKKSAKKENYIAMIYDIWRDRDYINLSDKDFHNIKELDLSLLMWQYLLPEFGYLDTLESLNLSGNYLTELPDTLWKLHNLQNLSFGSVVFGGNPITTISPKIRNLKKLEILDISSCDNLLSIPKELLELENLLYLRMSQYSLYKSSVVQTLQKETNCCVLFEEALPPIK